MFACGSTLITTSSKNFGLSADISFKLKNTFAPPSKRAGYTYTMSFAIQLFINKKSPLSSRWRRSFMSNVSFGRFRWDFKTLSCLARKLSGTADARPLSLSLPETCRTLGRQAGVTLSDIYRKVPALSKQSHNFGVKVSCDQTCECFMFHF